MTKTIIALLLFMSGIGCTQGMKLTGSVDLGSAQEIIPNDTNAVNELLRKSRYYFFSRPDSCLHFAQQAVDLAHKLSFTNGEIKALHQQGEAQRFLGNYPQALESQFQALELSINTKQKSLEARSLGFIGFTYSYLGEYRQALPFQFSAKAIYEQINYPEQGPFNLSNIGDSYAGLGLLDSALFFLEKALPQAHRFNDQNLIALTLHRLGSVRVALGDYDEALRNYHASLVQARKFNDRVNQCIAELRIAELHLKLHRKDSSLFYARLALTDATNSTQRLQILHAANHIANILREGSSTDSIIYYQDIVLAMKDSVFGPNKFKQLQVLALREQQKKSDLLVEQDEFRNQFRLFGLTGILVFVAALAFILYKNYRRKHKVNLILEEQKLNLEQTLLDLKATQTQLIQFEKMASLGELTAGIAHEIQNPLNFVNNFSDINKELISDLKAEIKKENFSEADSIAGTIENNEDKINHHGKRADAIVKGMLQHSRSSTGIKEPTNINALAEKYIKLAYHGLRAKDKTFNVTLKTDYDEGLGPINVIPQDIGRVMLNLINNAFYAVSAKASDYDKASSDKSATADGTFVPLVYVSTKISGDKVLISVKDNGNGIPQSIVDKIFQPFFTTKPTGQGTGLGLSLSYDIVKAHGGTMKVQTPENEGAEFLVELPIA